MTTTSDRGSATIYQFPARGRFAVGTHPDEAAPAVAVVSARATKTVLGGAWYHDEAVAEERARQN